VLLRVKSDNEGWNVHDLLSNTDVPLLDEDTGMVDALRKTKLVDTGLEAALQEIFDLEGEHVIELHAGFIEHTDTDETANEGIAFEQALGVFFVESKKLTGGTTNLREREHDTPHFTLVPETVFADNLQFGITKCKNPSIPNVQST